MWPPTRTHGRHSRKQYSEVTKAASLEANCAYVAVYNTWKRVLERKYPSSLLGNNTNHPNDSGHCLHVQSFEAMTYGSRF